MRSTAIKLEVKFISFDVLTSWLILLVYSLQVTLFHPTPMTLKPQLVFSRNNGTS